jgi:hypothetical protein
MFFPASNSLRMLKICVSVNRFFFMSNSLKLKDFRLILNCPIFRGAYTSNENELLYGPVLFGSGRKSKNTLANRAFDGSGLDRYE